MSNTNHIHVHEHCLKCGICKYECEHRAQVQQTSTASTTYLTMTNTKDRNVTINIVPDTPENLIETIDWATKKLINCAWYEFGYKRFWKRQIVELHKKRVMLLANSKETKE